MLVSVLLEDHNPMGITDGIYAVLSKLRFISDNVDREVMCKPNSRKICKSLAMFWALVPR